MEARVKEILHDPRDKDKGEESGKTEAVKTRPVVQACSMCLRHCLLCCPPCRGMPFVLSTMR